MDEWVEERCEAIRLALRIPGFPTEEDLYRLVEWLSGIVILRHRDVPLARCRHRGDGRSVITLPAGLMGRQFDEKLSHELGHSLLTMGMGELLRQEAGDRPGLLRLAESWRRRDEALAAAFTRAWRLPSRLVAEFGEDVDGLAWASHCCREMVQRRREDLGGRVVRLTTTPRWAAAREYVLAAHPERPEPLLTVYRKGNRQPAFAFTCANRGAWEGAAMQVSADLVALTATEFGIKYQPVACGEEVGMEIGLEQLQAWAGLVEG